ncbi:tape measure protein [Schinkia azotoformans]|uniref:tape measure protein n=1 Tax=Schinkia azotoformans TaxID=1454 RepID=UPI002DBAE009|nr:tape measure protein [Schinkia azotoformans]MEC1786090.1 tape measure protein [Schinkia azotoformans]MED4420126.1 tape measure protein [Schinkia azotoformans]
MAKQYEIVTNIVAKTQGFIDGLNKAKDSTNKFSSNLKNSLKANEENVEKLKDKIDGMKTGFKVAGTAVVAGFGALVASGIKANSEMEQYRNTLNTVMGDSKKAGETLDWVKKYAAKTPFEMPGLVEATTKLSAMGLEAEKFLPMAGDMAAVFKSSGKSVGDAAEAINDAMMGEFERLKEFGIKLQQTDFKEGGKYAGKTYAEALEEEFKAHNYAGAAEALSTTFSGRLSTLKDTVSMFLQDTTAPLFTNLAEKMGNLLSKIDEFKANGKLDEWANKTTEAFSSAWGVVEQVGGFLVSTGKFIYDNWSVIAPILAGVLGGFMAYQTVVGVINAVQMAQAGLNLVMSMNPIGLVIAAIVALVAAFVVAYKKSETFRDIVNGVWDALKKGWDSTLKFFTETIPKWVSDTVNYFVGLKDQVVANIEELGQKGNEIISAFTKYFISTLENLKQVGSGLIKVFVGLITGDFSKMKEGVSQIVGGLKNQVINYIDLLRNLFGNKVDEMLTKAQNGFQRIRDAIMSPITTAKDKVLELIDRMKNAFNFNWSLPKIKLPHLSIKGKFSIDPPSVPSFGINWYAKGSLFKGNNPRIVGIGEASHDEAILPLKDSVLGKIGAMIAKTMDISAFSNTFSNKSGFSLESLINPLTNAIGNSIQSITENKQISQTLQFSPQMTFKVEGGLDENQANKYADLTIDRMIDRFKPYGFFD